MAEQGSTYTAKAESKSEGIVITGPPLKATATGTGTGSGSTQPSANIAAEEAAKRASRTALDTVKNIIHQVWENLATGFKKEYPIGDVECYITFDADYIAYANNGAVAGNTSGPGLGGYFWQAGFSGEAYKLVEFPIHIQPVGPHFGTISAFISQGTTPLADRAVLKEYSFNITVNSAIYSDIAGLFEDKKYNFSSQMTWVGTFGTSKDLVVGDIPGVVLAILNDDLLLPSGYNYDSSKTNITLNTPGLALTDALGIEKKKIVLNGAYDFLELPHEVALNTTHLDNIPAPPKTVYKIGSKFDRAFVGTDPIGGFTGDQFVAEDKVIVTALGKEKKK